MRDKWIAPCCLSVPDEPSLRMGCWRGRRRDPQWSVCRNGGSSGATEPSSQRKRRAMRDLFSRDERAWRKAKRAGAKSAQAPHPTGTRVGHGGPITFNLRHNETSMRVAESIRRAMASSIIEVLAPRRLSTAQRAARTRGRLSATSRQENFRHGFGLALGARE